MMAKLVLEGGLISVAAIVRPVVRLCRTHSPCARRNKPNPRETNPIEANQKPLPQPANADFASPAAHAGDETNPMGLARFTPSPGTPGEGWGEGSRDRRGSVKQHQLRRTLTLPSPGVPGEGKASHGVAWVSSSHTTDRRVAPPAGCVIFAPLAKTHRHSGIDRLDRM